ncbi:hypothetical protein CC78DRAFT_473148 [Lojkania enalia]|uniref:Uncharacterized protein n=1 Tax=Lojkania enalia TaxID=147567 RepID=A0A9P4K3T2_9PLEO|nr:hypothetical protein CC78DRAFT_473148 [Didymosphaeria enalia]
MLEENRETEHGELNGISSETLNTEPAQAQTIPQNSPSTRPVPSATDQYNPEEEQSETEQQEIQEWKSWKIRWPFMGFLLIIVLLFIITIALLMEISRKHSGFARESDPPSFLVRYPRVKKAIWEQGILYTAFPAFVMTIYRPMWDSAIMAIADRQPYVDLMSRVGEHPRRTILLDYKAEPLLYRWAVAIRNHHFLLAACLFSSLTLSFAIVPLTSFLFTMDSALLNATSPLTIDTVLNISGSMSFPINEHRLNLRLALDSAAGMYLQNASSLPWTDGSYAFPAISSHTDTGNGNFSLESFATGLDAGCRVLSHSEYEKEVRPLPGSGGYLVEIHGNDRGCAINHALDIRTGFWSPDVSLNSWYTPTCSAESGLSRISLMAAAYNKHSQEVQNFTLISCRTSYFNTSGRLKTMPKAGSKTPLIVEFIQDSSSRTHDQWDFGPVRTYFEMQVNSYGCFDTETRVTGNEIAKYIYRLSSQMNPMEPLSSGGLASATRRLLQSTYAIFAAATLFQPLDIPLTGYGTFTVEEKRLFVVEPVGYIILAVLSITAILNVWIFFYNARHKSILGEEPYGLLSAAGILYKSDVNTAMMKEIVSSDNGSRRARETAQQLYRLRDVKCRWHESEGRITLNIFELQDQS